MSVNAARKIVNVFTGDVELQSYLSATDNEDSPAEVEFIDLSSGANTITAPDGAVAVTIIPPAGNLILITLKGITGDTGIPLHKTDPTSIGIDTTLSTFV